ncbi:quinone-dependent dihydroorotate dehydrogenase [Leucothrix arctica]|uniref:Dihydroorotate dehydrogenase (quinone) n=1 Tax=Leucothrix arctica TaxID=1481894 RepID=A0A317CEW2_9GAMM|nr:quinone-dependent dihydroorotate dehydrogenase [Leucothrix arctica]PWQ95903.1 quinone-dependent dihydroorotate dehydrogenase [Leucothrix arctica]
MYSIARHLLFRLPAETSHDMTLKGLNIAKRFHLLNLVTRKVASKSVEVMGLTFPNRVGLAAGLDKNGDYLEALSDLGFGFVEIGTVTPLPQAGNDKPRMFRLPAAQGIINRMGFNNFGVDHLVENVKQARANGFKGVIGINIGKNAATPVEKAMDDYLICLRKSYQHADYITINISSPNTPGLRSLQYGEELNALLSVLKAEQVKLSEEQGRYVPLAVKVAPDLSVEEVEGIAECLVSNGIDALIATNTTLARDAVEGMKYGTEAGGLSGAPVTEKSTQVIAQFAKALEGKMPIIGVGGIFNAADAQAKLDAGASLVQLYSGLIYQGPKLVTECVTALDA